MIKHAVTLIMEFRDGQLGAAWLLQPGPGNTLPLQNRPPWSPNLSCRTSVLLSCLIRTHGNGGICLPWGLEIGSSVRVGAMAEWIEEREVCDLRVVGKSNKCYLGSPWKGSSWRVASSQVCRSQLVCRLLSATLADLLFDASGRLLWSRSLWGLNGAEVQTLEFRDSQTRSDPASSLHGAHMSAGCCLLLTSCLLLGLVLIGARLYPC